MISKVQNSNTQALLDALAKRTASTTVSRDAPQPNTNGTNLAGELLPGIPQRGGKAPASGADGLVAIELDPSKRPALDTFGRGPTQTLIDTLHTETNERAKSAAELRDLAGSLDIFTQVDAKPADLMDSIDADLQATTGRETPKDDGGLKTNPRTNQQMAPTEGSTDSTTTSTDDKTTGEKIVDAAKTAATFVHDWVIDVVMTKSGPPGPWLTPLTGPAALDGAGGDVGAVAEGAKTIGEMQDGNYFDKRLREFGVHTPTPDGTDAPANAGEAAAKSKLGRLIGAMVGPIVDRLRATDKSQISQPGEDGERPRPGRDEIGSHPGFGSNPRTGNATNPGSGENDVLFGGAGGKAGPLPSRDPGFVDPPEMLGGTRPRTPDRGPTPSSGPGTPDED